MRVPVGYAAPPVPEANPVEATVEVAVAKVVGYGGRVLAGAFEEDGAT